jgi:hypothetical protein
LFAILRLAFSLVAYVAATFTTLVHAYAPPENAAYIHRQTTGFGFRLLGVWQTWDACWFEKIATVNYQQFDPAVAYPPFYPLLMHIAGVGLADNFALGGLIVSGLSYIIAMIGLHRLVSDDWNETIAQRTVLYLSIFPTAFFLFAPYAEALFLALTVWSFYFARRGAWLGAAITACLAGLTRSPGILLAVPLAWEVFRHWRAGRRVWLSALVPLLPLGSFLLYNEYSKMATGWSYFQGVAVWGTVNAPLWTAIIESARFVVAYRNPIEALNLGLLLFFLLLLLFGMKRLPVSYTLYAGAQILLIGARQAEFTPLMSSSRYFVVVFPLFIILATTLQLRLTRHLWVATSVALSLALFLLFLRGAFVA